MILRRCRENDDRLDIFPGVPTFLGKRRVPPLGRWQDRPAARPEDASQWDALPGIGLALLSAAESPDTSANRAAPSPEEPSLNRAILSSVPAVAASEPERQALSGTEEALLARDASAALSGTHQSSTWPASSDPVVTPSGRTTPSFSGG
jgi:hypothetical protein